MATYTPTIKTYEAYLGEMIATYASKIGVNDLNEGSAVLSFFECVAQALYRASGDTLSILRDFSVDRAKGEALQRIARDENLPPLAARAATGIITITDSNITKISTKVYAGGNPPNILSLSIQVSDASEFPSTGAIYVGRGTPNIEGPISYSSIVNIGSYYEIQLVDPTTKYHNLSESVILSQGGTRVIPTGTVVQTASSGGVSPIAFTTTLSATILDGETEISAVPIAAQEPGIDGNVPRNAIKEFVTAPFSGATVSNPNPLTTGRNLESDMELRNRIKRARSSRGLGTATAIKNSILNAQAADENTVIVSSEIFSDGDETTLYIDNGEGYEEKSTGVGLESIIDSALGGETHFQLAMGGRQTSIAKAFVETNTSAPYNIYPNDIIAFLVGGILSEHTFASGDFQIDGFATAYEIVASINANPSLTFLARTTNNGTKISISAKSETNEYIQATSPTVGTDANEAFLFPSNEVQTLKLYQSKQPLSRNGRSATISSASQDSWSNTITDGDTLIISVDGTSSITYTFSDSDFIAEGTYLTVAKSNSLQSWVNVINTKVTGVTASINGTQLVLVSNLGAQSRASLSIGSGSTLVSKGVFSSIVGLESQGRGADFVLSRNTGQLKLLTGLSAGDRLSTGSEFTNGEIISTPILGGTAILPSDAYLWFIMDNVDAETINHGVSSGSVINFTKRGGNVVRFHSELSNAFVNIQEGDYVIIWTEELSANNRLEGRVMSVGTDANPFDYFELRLNANEYALTIDELVVVFSEGLVFVRSDTNPQKVKISAGIYDINDIAISLSAGLYGATVGVEGDEYLKVLTNTNSTDGAVLLVTYNDSAKALNLEEGGSGQSIQTHFAYYESQNELGQFPLFVHSEINSAEEADPPNTTIASFDSSIDLDTNGIDQNALIGFLNPYLYSGSYVQDLQPRNELVQLNAISGFTNDIAENLKLRRFRVGDRFFVASPFDFSHSDSLVIVLDSDPSNKTFPIKLYRRAITNSTMPSNASNFRAYDVESGTTETFDTYFGPSFDFSNYKALMRARYVIDPISATDEDAVLFRSARWGSVGNRCNIAYTYPTGADNDISHTINIEDEVDIRISLKSGAAVPNAIDGTTEWNITVPPPVGGVEEVTYTWNGVGSNPAMLTSAVGHYVTITSGGNFNSANLGTFRISTRTDTSFTVRRPAGSAVAENNISTLQVGVVNVYENDDTTATEIVDYVADSLSDYLSAEIIDDNGSTGSGIISLSTYEDNDFASGTDSIYLVDGINWISVSNVSAASPNPNFTFKEALTMEFFPTNTPFAYEFRNGEEVRLIPTTIKHLQDFISTLAVTGITTLSDVESSQVESKLQIGSKILGSLGSVQISGGTGNSLNASIIGSSSAINGSNYIKSTISRASSGSLSADQWVKLSTSIAQKKETDLTIGSDATIEANKPSSGESTIILGNRANYSRYFGQPRNHIRDSARAFHVEKHGSLVCISWDGLTGTHPVFTKTVEFNDDGGNMSVAYNSVTGYTEYTVATGNRNFNEASPGDQIVIINFADSGNNGTFIVNAVSNDGQTINVDNSDGVTAAPAVVNIGDITITTEIEEGDSVKIGDPFAAINQGIFRVIRRFNNSIYIDHPSAAEERVVVTDNLRSLGFDGTTQFDITVPGDMRIAWNNTGTEPTLENSKLGDIITLGTAFNADNQGDFMITNTHYGRYETTRISCVEEADITTGQYFTIDLPNLGVEYYVWYNIDGGGGDPAPLGKTGIEVAISSGDSASSVASATQAAIDAVVGFTASVSTFLVTVICDEFGESISAANSIADPVGGSFAITIVQKGRLQYVECANAKAVVESGITVTGAGADILQVHEPSMVFSSYETTIATDKLVISSNILGSTNIGSYTITEVISKHEVVVNSIMSPKPATSLVTSFGQVYVEEATPYVGYKRIYNIAASTSNANRSLIIFDTNNQVSKINQLANVLLSAMNRLNFPTLVVQGLDSYRYNTGLIAEANRIVYGDPRSPISYPGVSAAGAEIFILPPIVQRIEISINIRVKTGIPFSQVVEQVKNNIAALVNSSPIGESIAISDIISSVNTIPGVKAVSLTSPAYSPSNDVIIVGPSQKPFILDISTDIIVARVG